MTLLVNLPTRNQAQDSLRAWSAVPDDMLDIGVAALSLGVLHDRTQDIERFRDHLDRLAIETSQIAQQLKPQRVEQVADILNRIIVQYHGYKSAPSDLPQAAHLPRAIERRTGLPLTIALLYINCARAMGWDIALLNFPDAALLRLEFHGRRLIINIANEGQPVAVPELRQMVKNALGNEAELKPDYYNPLSNRDILLRLQNAAKLRYMRTHRDDQTAIALEGLLLLAPEKAHLWREFGLVLTRLGEEHRAVIALENYMVLADGDSHLDQTTQLLEQLKSLIAIGG